IALLSQLKAISFNPPFTLPLYREFQLVDVNWTKCRVMNSKKKPLYLSFVLNKHSRMNSILGGHLNTGKDTLNILVKKGDDLRKDEIISEIILLLSFLLESKGVPSCFQYYACMATSGDEGLIEIVDNAITVGSLYDQ
ncbi:hypothetical protein WA538_003487, partial [Blastocystis sp. DL]